MTPAGYAWAPPTQEQICPLWQLFIPQADVLLAMSNQQREASS
jgi:hypothetical protein